MIVEKKLDNGIRIVMEQISYVQSVSAGIWIRTGAVDEDDSNSGISHLIEHMMFKGTKRRSPKQIAEDADRIGAGMNAFTGKEATCYYIKSLTSSMERAFDILIDMITGSVFDPTELSREKDVIFEEIKMVEDSPDDQISELLDTLVFEGSPYSRSVLGTREALTGIDRDRIIDHIKKEYTADNIVVSVSGNFEESKIMEIFNNGLQGFVAEKTPKKFSVPHRAAKHLVKVKDVEQAHFCMGIRSLPHQHALHYPMQVLSSAFGGSMSSRLFQNIREQKGLAYSIFSASHHFSADGVFEVFAGISMENVGKVIDAISEEMSLLRANGVTPDELAIAREQVKSSYVFGRENVNNRMFANGKNVLLYGKALDVDAVIARINGITEEQMHEAASVVTDMSRYSSALICGKEYDLSKRMKEAVQ